MEVSVMNEFGQNQRFVFSMLLGGARWGSIPAPFLSTEQLRGVQLGVGAQRKQASGRNSCESVTNSWQ